MFRLLTARMLLFKSSGVITKLTLSDKLGIRAIGKRDM